MAAASPATLVFLLSLICAPSRFLTGALPPTPQTPPKPVMPAPAMPYNPVMPIPTTPPKPVMPAPAMPYNPVMPVPTTPPKPVMPAPTTPPKPVMPAPTTPYMPVTPPPVKAPKPVTPAPATPPKPVLPPPATPTKPVLPPPKPVIPPIAIPPAPWEEPGYGSNPIPEEIKMACRRTPFPELCGRVLGFVVDPQRVNDTRWLAETSLRVAIEAGTGLAAFGWVNVAGAPSGTRLRMCVRDCTVRVDAAVKNLTASQVALRRGELRVAMQQLGDAAKGCGMCWGSCASFTGEAMQVMVKRARQFERLVMIAGSVILIIIK